MSTDLVPTVHASCVVVGTVGILIRGASGAGKSSLADHLVEAAAAKGHFAAHVADDRTCLRADSGRLLAAPAPALAGKLEVRGLGIVDTDFVTAAVIRLVVDLRALAEIDRLPEDHAGVAELLGCRLPLVQVEAARPCEALSRLRWSLRRLFPKSPDYI